VPACPCLCLPCGLVRPELRRVLAGLAATRRDLFTAFPLTFAADGREKHSVEYDCFFF
jgi:hypothetical protein